MLNRYFLDISERLKLAPDQIKAVYISRAHWNVSKYFSNVNTIFPTTTGHQKLLSDISKVKNKNSSRLDGIPMFLIKRVAEIIAPILAYIFDYSLSLGVFPNLLKFATVTLIQKSKRHALDNFWAFSLLPVFFSFQIHWKE